MTDRELLEFIAARVETLTITIEELRGQVEHLKAWADSLVEAKHNSSREGTFPGGIN